MNKCNNVGLTFDTKNAAGSKFAELAENQIGQVKYEYLRMVV